MPAVGLVVLEQGLRMVAPVSGAPVLAVPVAGVVVDPAAVPVLASVSLTRLRVGP